MSDTGIKLSLGEARAIADHILAVLQPVCDRIEVAGSIRRGAPEVGDIELVAIPRTEHRQFDLFGEPVGPPTDCLHDLLAHLLTEGVVQKRKDRSGRTFWGARDKRLVWTFGDVAAPVDVFGALPTTWGRQLAIRTGPMAFSKALVTQRAKGGLCPNDCEFADGGIYRYVGMHRRFVPTPEEEDLFRELGLPWMEPADRHEWQVAGARA